VRQWWTESRDGSATVELAVVLPLLALLLMGLADYGRLMYGASAVTYAARAGASFGARSVGSSSNLAGMRQAAVDAGSDVNILLGDVAASKVCECADGTAISCTGTPICDRLIYAQVITKNISGFSNYSGMGTKTITRSAKIRAQ
jgi:hypothetical protein